jgi:hypothetical protein
MHVNSPARFENSRQFANAVMHPESEEAISYRRVQSQRLEAVEKTEELVAKARREAEYAANATYENDKVGIHDIEAEEGGDSAKLSFRRRLVDILVYGEFLIIPGRSNIRVQQEALARMANPRSQ